MRLLGVVVVVAVVLLVVLGTGFTVGWMGDGAAPAGRGEGLMGLQVGDGSSGQSVTTGVGVRVVEYAGMRAEGLAGPEDTAGSFDEESVTRNRVVMAAVASGVSISEGWVGAAAGASNHSFLAPFSRAPGALNRPFSVGGAHKTSAFSPVGVGLGVGGGVGGMGGGSEGWASRAASADLAADNVAAVPAPSAGVAGVGLVGVLVGWRRLRG